ncbi:unnamed protein product, partial [Didymodactylos carnosus]
FYEPYKINMFNHDQAVKHANRSRQLIWREFLETSTIDGLKSIADARKITNCIFWLITFFVCVGAMVYFVVSSIIEYYGYETETQVSINIEYPMVFPAFSICNAVTLRADVVKKPFIDYLFNKSLISSNDYTQTLTESESRLINSFMIDLINSGVPYKDLKKYGFMLEDMLINCVLDLQLYTYNELSMPYINDQTGIVSIVHDNAQLPQIDTEGITLAPGMKHLITYEKKSSSFLGAPYTPCTSKSRADLTVLFHQYDAEYEYNQVLCLAACQQAYIYTQCNCTDPNNWNYHNILINNILLKSQICVTYSVCVIQAKGSFVKVESDYCSHCQQECSLITYTAQSSSFNAPRTYELDYIKKNIESKNVSLPMDWNISYSTYINNNYVAIKVIRLSNIVENYAQQPTITPTGIVSDIGGQTGL